jgi:hypothetical protein
MNRLLAECKLQATGGVLLGDAGILLRSASQKGYLDYARFTSVAGYELQFLRSSSQ